MSRSSFSSVHLNATRLPAAVDGEPPPRAPCPVVPRTVRSRNKFTVLLVVHVFIRLRAGHHARSHSHEYSTHDFYGPHAAAISLAIVTGEAEAI
eukprot:3379391-Prymnesium_polylepis.1